MRQAIHIARKDLRRQRWLFVAWCAGIVAQLLLETAGLDAALEIADAQFAVAQIRFILAVLETLLAALLVSRLVHDEPLVGPEAFWLTRPIAGGSLLAAKLAMTAFFLIALPLVAETIRMAWAGTPGRDMLLAIPPWLLTRTIWVLLLMTLAVLTPSLARYVLVIVAIIAAFASLIAAVTISAFLFPSDDSFAEGRSAFDPTPAVVAQVLFIAALAAVIVFQYRRRRWTRALLVLAAGLLVAWIVPGVWPWSFMRPLPPAPVLPAADAAAITAVADANAAPRLSENMFFRRRGAPTKEIAIQVNVFGLPSDVAVQNIIPDTTLTLPGTTLEMRRRAGYALLALGGSFPASQRSAEAALAARVLAGSFYAADSSWPTILRVDDNDFARYGSTPGRLTASFDVVLTRSVVVATLPLADGQAVQLGSMRVSLARVFRGAAGCTLMIRQARVEPLFALPQYRHLAFFLRNRARGEAVGGDRHFGMYGPGAMSLLPFSMHMGPGPGSGFMFEQADVRFPAMSRPDEPPPAMDPAWLDGAELAIVEMVPAGTVTRQIEIANFRMRP